MKTYKTGTTKEFKKDSSSTIFFTITKQPTKKKKGGSSLFLKTDWGFPKQQHVHQKWRTKLILA